MRTQAHRASNGTGTGSHTPLTTQDPNPQTATQPAAVRPTLAGAACPHVMSLGLAGPGADLPRAALASSSPPSPSSLSSSAPSPAATCCVLGDPLCGLLCKRVHAAHLHEDLLMRTSKCPSSAPHTLTARLPAVASSARPHPQASASLIAHHPRPRTWKWVSIC